MTRTAVPITACPIRDAAGPSPGPARIDARVCPSGVAARHVQHLCGDLLNDCARVESGRHPLQLGRDGTPVFGMLEEPAQPLLQRLLPRLVQDVGMAVADLRIAAYLREDAAVPRVHRLERRHAEAF